MTQRRKLAAEFATIVVGVLTALGMEAWYGHSVDQGLGFEYESRIVVELRDARHLLDEFERQVTRNIEATGEASTFFDGEGAPISDDRIVVLLYNVGRDIPRRFDVSTFEDLISTGRLGLIADAERREVIQQAYKALADLELKLSPHRDEYLRGVRGWVPQRLIDRIRAECPSMSDVEWACPRIEFDDPSVPQLVQRFRTDQALIAFRLREQGLFSTEALIGAARASVEEAIDLLQRQR